MPRSMLLCSALALAVAASGPAQALTFSLIDSPNGVAGAAARKGFQIAADYWSSIFTNNVNVRVQIGYYSFGPDNSDVLGSASSSRFLDYYDSYYGFVEATRSNSGVDQLVSQYRPDTANGGLAMLTPGYIDEDAQTGIDTATRVYDADGSTNNQLIYMTTANAKAAGYGAHINPAGIDARIQFNADFEFDFDPTDGIDAGKSDFTLVAIHEIGHALGFVSGVDDYDILGAPNSPFLNEACYSDGTLCSEIAANDEYWGSALDLFRYSTDADGVAPGDGPVLDWSVRDPNDPAAYPDYTANPYFSLDGGVTMGIDGNQEAYFSRGEYNGASYQASHWRIGGANNGVGNPTQPQLGVMDPVGRTGNLVTALDIAAFDAIGWNSRVDALANPEYARSTASIFAAFVPEPATWAQMIAGFGLIGGAARRRRRTAATAAA